jgi:hypothetical protein
MINRLGRLYPGGVSGLPYVEELVRRLQTGMDGRQLVVEYGSPRTVTLSWPHRQEPHRVTLVVSEPDLAAAIAAMGPAAQELIWPECTADDAGFNHLLVNLDELVGTYDTSEPLRITANGLQWPGRRSHHRGHRR